MGQEQLGHRAGHQHHVDPSDPAYRWVDRGPVVRSAPESDFNAIDPGIIEDADGTPWMAFGSYWNGIRMVQLQWPTGKRSADTDPLHLADRKAAPNAIEAPYIVRHDGYYYLFASWDHCCQGVNSDYKVAVGRSRGDRPVRRPGGRALLDGGGTVVADARRPRRTGRAVGVRGDPRLPLLRRDRRRARRGWPCSGCPGATTVAPVGCPEQS